MKITPLVVLLLISILVLQIGLQTVSVTVTGKNDGANTYTSESVDQSTQLSPTVRVNYKPYVPPEPHAVLKESEDPLAMAGFDVLKREETVIASTDSSQLSVELGASSTASYEGLLQQMSPETVFLPDGRSVVTYSSTMSLPWRTICKLYVTAADGTQWMGSGCIIGPGQAGQGYHLLTAGHMVYMSDHGGWISTMEVIPGFDDYQAQLYQQMPYYHSWVTYMRSYTGWTVDENHQHDWAVCTLDRCIGDYTGWMGRMTASSGSSIYTGVLRTAGYPGDKDGGYRMYTDSNNGRTADEYNHWYYMDTYGGQSGSPVWYNDGTSNYIITVHAYGDDGSSSNHGTRLNQDKFDRINTWIASDAVPADMADLTDDGQTFSSFSPTTVVAGTMNFYVTCDVRNFGTSAANNFYVSYYASTDQIITSSDYQIGTQFISSISPFGYADSFWQGVFPSTVPPGTYWVGWIIDSTNAVSEFDETNNIGCKTSYPLIVQSSLPTITFNTNPTSFVASPGTITFGSATYSNGQTGSYASADYNATANAPSGYVFHHWEYSGLSGSGVYVPNINANPATVQVRGTGWLKAVFSAQITFYTTPSSVGSIRYGSSSNYTNGQTRLETNLPPEYSNQFSVTANVPSGYSFGRWSVTGGLSVANSSINPTNLTVTGTGTLTAIFNSTAPQLTFYTNPTSFVASPGTITFGSATYSNGQTGSYASADYNATANAPSGYVFHHWEYSGLSGSGVYVPNINANPATVQVRGTGWLKAVFSAQITFYTTPSSVGSIRYGSSSNYTNGQTRLETNLPPEYSNQFSVTANVPSGYSFGRWSVTGGLSVANSSINPTNLTVTGTGTLTAIFNSTAPQLTFYTNPTSFVASPGTITFGSATYSNGQTGSYASADYNATANAPSGYVFHHWEYSGLSGSGVYVPNINANPATVQVRGTGWLKAVFSAQITFYTTPSSVGSIRYGSSSNYTNGQTRLETNLPPEYSNQFSVTANVPSGYSFGRWSVTGGLSVANSSINPTNLTVTGTGTLTAIFNSTAPQLTMKEFTSWYWTNNTMINSVASGDVDNDGFKEIVTGGYFFDGTRTIAQLVVWNGSNLAVDRLTSWYWTGNTTINSVALGDVDGDNQTEIVTGGFFNDGVRNVAQLIVWNGATLAVERLTTWYWTGNTVINSVAIGNVDGDGQVEIVTGGYFNDGARNVAQLIEWNGANLAVDRLTTWYWTSNTVINSVALRDVDNDSQVEVVTGGYFNDGARNVAQLIEWNGANLAVDRFTTWYWTSNTVVNSVALGDVDGDGQVEVITGGYFNDGVRNIAQLVEWNGANLAVDRLTGWYWTSNTAINSVAIGDVDGVGQAEIVTGGYYNDGIRSIAQLIIWSGSSLAAENIKTWYWTGNTTINSVAVGDVVGDSLKEIIVGGAFHDGTRLNSQLTVWGMT